MTSEQPYLGVIANAASEVRKAAESCGHISGVIGAIVTEELRQAAGLCRSAEIILRAHIEEKSSE